MAKHVSDDDDQILAVVLEMPISEAQRLKQILDQMRLLNARPVLSAGDIVLIYGITERINTQLLHPHTR